MRATDDNQTYAKDISTRIGKTIYSFYLETVIEGLLDLLDHGGWKVLISLHLLFRIVLWILVKC